MVRRHLQLSYPSWVSGWSAMTPWKMRLFFLFCSKSYLQQLFGAAKHLTCNQFDRDCIFSHFLLHLVHHVVYHHHIILINFSHFLLHLIQHVVHHLESIFGPARLCFHFQELWLVFTSLEKEHWWQFLVGTGLRYDINLFKTVIYELPVLLPHGQSREFFQCTQPQGNQLKA